MYSVGVSPGSRPAHCRGEVNYRREGGSSPAQAVMGLLLVGMDAQNYGFKKYNSTITPLLKGTQD